MVKESTVNDESKSEILKFHKWPYATEREKELIGEVLDSGKWWRMSGDKVKTFEKNFAALHNVNYCLAVTNGTHAIELALSTLDIGAGDEVIVPAVTFISTASAVIYANATPVLVDIDPETFCMRPEAFEEAITPKTKAVIPVHMAGHACDMEKICEIAKRYNIRVIEDAAHAHGGEYNNKKVGSFGDIGIFSFQNGKIMTCGEGGALITNDKKIYEKAYLIHCVGRPKGDIKYEHRVLGSNYRMNEFSAAILIAQQERLERMNNIRECNASYLDKLLCSIKGIVPQTHKPYATVHTHYMYMFYYDTSYFNDLSRESFIKQLNDEGIPAFVCFPVLSDVEFYKQQEFRRKINRHSIPNNNAVAKEVSNNVVWLPHYTLLGDRTDMEKIANVIKKIQLNSTKSMVKNV